MRFHHAYGIDIGTSSVKIYDDKESTIKKEYNMIAIQNQESVYAIGNGAYEVFGKTPENISVEIPMTNGRISDVYMMEAILHTLLGHHNGFRPVLFFSVPTDMTEIERRAYKTIGHRGRLRRSRIFLVEKPIADALAFGIPVSRTQGSMLINLGAQNTEISVVADSRIIIRKVVPIGGHSINAAIVASVRRRNNFAIGEKTAKRLKLSLTDLTETGVEARKVYGIDVKNALPTSGVVSTYSVTSAVREELDKMMEEILSFLKRLPPQLISHIEEEGIYICGGTSKIKGLAAYLTQKTGFTVRISGYYDLHTVSGVRELMIHDTLHHYAHQLV